MFLKPSSLRVGFSLLVGATLAIGVLSLRLLGREEVRVADDARRALQDRAQVIADDLQLAVQGVENDMLTRVDALSTFDAPGTLSKWPETHPLVRNTFVWNQAGRRLEWPDPAAPTTEEERGFIKRYEHLFAARLEAMLRSGESDDRSPQQQASPRVQLQQEAQQLAVVDRQSAGRRGWIPWFEGDQLFLLGWVEHQGRVAGVELEMTALLARVIQAFPREVRNDRAWALLDGAGNVIHQSGGFDVPKGAKPVITAGLGAALPHWQVALYSAGTPVAGGGGSVRLASVLLVASLLVSILVGGSLLLWEAGRRAREARQKTSFVSNVSHELKTPLTTLRLYAELLREGRVKGEDKQRHYLDVMIAECARLGRLVNNMLDFSRLEQRRRSYAVETLELTEWLDAFLEPQRIRFQEAGLQLNVHRPEGLLTVRTDRDALGQAVLNLLDNAIKYAAAGKEVELRLEANDDGVRLDVLDRGPGIPEALREKIFENFYRMNASLTARVPGSGLGLSIARRLLRDLGGDLLCLPRDGGGACFRIVLRVS
ncbi:MAG: HAMP domain-containing sensor histidine kinase [bacterium]